jgi:hypothetical protein
METSFFAGIRLPNGTFKTTGDRRLDDLNDVIARNLAPGHVRAKDVAVSSGITTVEWYESLVAAGFTCTMTATDIELGARLIACRGDVAILTDASGAVLQVDVSGFAFRPDQAHWRERLVYGVPLRIAASQGLRDRLTKASWDLQLVSPRLSRNPNVRVHEEDLMLPSPTSTRWDVVRAANILNAGYFAHDVLESMVTNIGRTVAIGGLLAICRTVEGVGNSASIFRRTVAGLDPVDELGGGSEIAQIARGVSL